MIDRISIEPSRFCTKGCSFCYNGSNRSGEIGFTGPELVELAIDCAKHGVRFLSIGGGEPLEWDGLFFSLAALEGVMARSFTTNGLPLEKDPSLYDRIAEARPDKVHLSIHAPENRREVSRVVSSVERLRSAGVDTGVNLLVRKSALEAARGAAHDLAESGVGRERLMFLPSRGVSGETPTPREMAWVAGEQPFQSMSCLRACGRSERFVSIGADRTVAFCSYTQSRHPLRALRFSAIQDALQGLGLEPCEKGMVRHALVRPRLAMPPHGNATSA